MTSYEVFTAASVQARVYVHNTSLHSPTYAAWHFAAFFEGHPPRQTRGHGGGGGGGGGKLH